MMISPALREIALLRCLTFAHDFISSSSIGHNFTLALKRRQTGPEGFSAGVDAKE